MQFLATAQPFLVQCEGPRQHTSLLTGLERTEFVDDLASGALGVLPLCIDHAGGDDPALAAAGAAGSAPFAVPGALVIGRVVHAAVRPNGQLLVFGEMFFERAESRNIADDIRAGQHWGVSLCTNLLMEADMTKVYSKRVTHVGVTRDPEYGAQNTWIHLAATNWPVFYRTFAADFVDKEPGMYMSQSLRDMVTPYLRELHAGRVVQQVSASRHSASETPARLGTPTPPAASLYYPLSRPLFQSRTMSDIAPPQSQAPRYSRDEVVRNIQTFLKRLAEKANGNVADFPISSANLQQAGTLYRDTLNFLRQEKIADDPEAWGGDIIDGITDLRNYQTQSVGKTSEFVESYYAEDPEVKAHAMMALRNPTLPENLPLVSQVMATRSAALVNQGQKEEQIRKATADVKLREEELAKKTKELEEFKRRMDEAEDKNQRLLEQIARTSKSEQQQQSLVAEPDQKRPRTDGQPIAVDVSASRQSGAAGFTMPSDMANARVVNPSHGRMNQYVPSSSPVLTDFMAKGYITPWRHAATAERISRLAGNL